jgi:hypothetical protein
MKKLFFILALVAVYAVSASSVKMNPVSNEKSQNTIVADLKRGRKFRPLFILRDYFSGNFLFLSVSVFLVEHEYGVHNTSVM